MDDAFAVVWKVMENMEIPIVFFHFGERYLVTGWYEYYFLGIVEQRAKLLFEIDDENTLDLRWVENQFFNKNYLIWENTSPNKKIHKLKAEIAEALEALIRDPEYINDAIEFFYSSRKVNSIFYSGATDLAGQEWFENHLKGREIEWQMKFVDIERATGNSNYGYREFYRFYGKMYEQAEASFMVIKYTNDRSNISMVKEYAAVVRGFCRKMDYDDPSHQFRVVLTENLDDPLPKNTLEYEYAKEGKKDKSFFEVADKLKKLKELLDMGAITNEEFEKEKKKLLEN